jgi:pimeloyl-ACP methyl ester carboxylesterase
MLANAGIPKRYVLVGHSMGGGQVRLFGKSFPKDVAGLVIVASGHEDWRTRNPSAGPAEDDGLDRMIRAVAVLSPTGLPRLIGVLFRPAVAAEYAAELRRYLPARAAESEITFLAQSKHARAMAAEIRTMRETEQQLRHARDFDDIPLIVLSEKWTFSADPRPTEAEAARIEDELQTEISRFSRRGKHIRVDAGHMIPLEKPDAIVNAIREILAAAKRP